MSVQSSHPQVSIMRNERPRTATACMMDAQDLASFVQPLITSFADEIGYTPRRNIVNDNLWKAMCLYADQSGVSYEEGSHSWACFKTGYKYPVVCFPEHPLEVQVYVGIYSWLGLLLDDEAARYIEEFEAFHMRFCADEKHPLPLLQAWADLMKLTFKYWDPVVANFIVSASLNFLNANVLEARKEFRDMKRTKAGASWAWFLRDKDGAGEAYAWFTFPKAICPDISCFLEVIPDLSAWIGKVNDVLSFYKEERAGERYNFVNSTAWYEDKSARTVFSDIVGDMRETTQRMRLVLRGRTPQLRLLNSHVLGYLAFHKLNSRYRLWEVGLGETKKTKT